MEVPSHCPQEAAQRNPSTQSQTTWVGDSCVGFLICKVGIMTVVATLMMILYQTPRRHLPDARGLAVFHAAVIHAVVALRGPCTWPPVRAGCLWRPVPGSSETVGVWGAAGPCLVSVPA